MNPHAPHSAANRSRRRYDADIRRRIHARASLTLPADDLVTRGETRRDRAIKRLLELEAAIRHHRSADAVIALGVLMAVICPDWPQRETAPFWARVPRELAEAFRSGARKVAHWLEVCLHTGPPAVCGGLSCCGGVLIRV